ncbi:uncharacterized protein METZ01_LOCUS264097, partial [marine metagenome]
VPIDNLAGGGIPYSVVLGNMPQCYFQIFATERSTQDPGVEIQHHHSPRSGAFPIQNV